MSASNPKKEKQQNNNAAGKKGGQNPPKQQQQKPKQSNNKAQAEDMKREQKLQAIILADSFSKTFRPITLECPKVLLPLVNVPMLDYTIEFLSQNNVEEIFVFCVWHAEKVEEYLRNSPWNDIVSIQCISSSSCTSAGDALREIDAMNVIRSDPFILISGDVVSNINLQKAIAYHKKKRQEDSQNIMTLTLKKVQKTSGSKPLMDDLVVGMNRRTSQIVLFDDNISKSKVRIPLPLLKNQELNFSTEYIDCNVDICSPELILQFSDNFDYRDIRKDFIHNEVTNFALGKHIYGYVLQNEYAARVQDPRSYHSICRDIVTRWVYPLVPDVQLLQSDTTYVQSKRHIYKEQGVKVSRSANIVEEVVIGRGSLIGDGSTVSRSTVGRNVRIGNRVNIRESHIWNNVVIEDNVDISQSIICDGAVIKSGSIIPRGSIISFGVVVEAGTRLNDFTRLTQSKADGAAAMIWEADKSVFNYNDEDNDMDDDSESPFDVLRAVRMTSVGCDEEVAWKRSLWSKLPKPANEDDSNYSDYDDEDDWKGPGNAVSDDDIDQDGDAQSGDASDSDSDVGSPVDRKAVTKAPRSPVPQRSGGRGQTPQVDTFYEHVVDLVSAAIVEKQPSSATLMEIKGLKFSHNKSFSDCVKATMTGVLSQLTATSVKEVVLKLKSLVIEGSIASDIISALKQNVYDELEVITAVEDFVLLPNKYNIFGTSLSFFLHALYDEDLISEDAILLWASNLRKLHDIIEQGDLSASEVDKQRLAMFQNPFTTKFLESLEDDSDDDDDDDEDDGESGDDDDDT